MGTITCRCGHYISTSREKAPFEASFIPDKSLDKLGEEVYAQLTALITATQNGHTPAQWLGLTSSSKEVEEALVTWNIWGQAFSALSRSIYQCEVCNRVYIETNTPNHFRSFLPEADDSQSILDATD